MSKGRTSKKQAMMQDLRIAEEKFLEERALRLIKYRSIFFEEYILLGSTVSTIFFDEIMYDFVYGAFFHIYNKHLHPDHRDGHFPVHGEGKMRKWIEGMVTTNDSAR